MTLLYFIPSYLTSGCSRCVFLLLHREVVSCLLSTQTCKLCCKLCRVGSDTVAYTYKVIGTGPVTFKIKKKYIFSLQMHNDLFFKQPAT